MRWVIFSLFTCWDFVWIRNHFLRDQVGHSLEKDIFADSHTDTDRLLRVRVTQMKRSITTRKLRCLFHFYGNIAKEFQVFSLDDAKNVEYESDWIRYLGIKLFVFPLLSVVMGRTPFYRTPNELKHHFLNMERTRTCSSIGDRTRTPYFWLQTNKNQTLNIIGLSLDLLNYSSNWLEHHFFEHRKNSKNPIFGFKQSNIELGTLFDPSLTIRRT